MGSYLHNFLTAAQIAALLALPSDNSSFTAQEKRNQSSASVCSAVLASCLLALVLVGSFGVEGDEEQIDEKRDGNKDSRGSVWGCIWG